MTPAEKLLWDLRFAGFDVRLSGGYSLTVDPGSRLKQDQRSAVIAHKPGLVAVLVEEERWLSDPDLLWELLTLGYDHFSIKSSGLFEIEPAHMVWPRLKEAIEQNRRALLSIKKTIGKEPLFPANDEGWRAKAIKEMQHKGNHNGNTEI